LYALLGSSLLVTLSEAAESNLNTIVGHAKIYDPKFATAAAEKTMLAAVSKAFTMKRMGDQRDGGYPIRLDYKSSCPKYRVLCPLPIDQADAVKAIPLEDSAQESCTRYTSLSKLR
jgi:plasmid stabilization system protein ParE